MSDHYATLGLPSTASALEIKQAFRQKASLFHPDKNASKDTAALFRAAQQAYEVLSNETTRAAYDKNRTRSLLDHPLETAGEIWQHYLKAVLK